MNPKYPIFIISKGRWSNPLTCKALELMNVPYNLVIEPIEYDNYAAIIDSKKILTLPFSSLGQGSIPARNWVWEYAVSLGVERHWILDDNISAFYRLNNNLQIQVTSGSIFCAAEDFVDRYENIALAGFQYDFFTKAKTKLPAFILNTRIYSCILIKNDLTYRWRGVYNEDTDLSLRLLKDGLCTVLFYAFTQGKAPTGTISGGNTDTIYVGDGRLKMAESLREQHPDVAKITWKFGRWQHQVNYRPFKKNTLIRKSNIIVPNKINNYTMILKET